jgi:hypothetical protein
MEGRKTQHVAKTCKSDLVYTAADDDIKMNHKKMECKLQMGSYALGYEPISGSCECDNGSPDPTKGGKLISLSDYQLLKRILLYSLSQTY